MSDKPDRNFGMDLARVTEAAALAAARWMGRGDKNGCDQAAVDAMRLMLNSLEMDGIVVIGEGEKDEAPMLYNGERLGTGNGPAGQYAGRENECHEYQAGQPGHFGRRGKCLQQVKRQREQQRDQQ